MFRPTYACKIRTLAWISGKEINWPNCKTVFVVCAGYSCQHVESLVATSLDCFTVPHCTYCDLIKSKAQTYKDGFTWNPVLESPLSLSIRLGSAPAASWLYKAQFLEAAAAMVILPIHLVIFLAEKPRLRLAGWVFAFLWTMKRAARTCQTPSVNLCRFICCALSL